MKDTTGKTQRDSEILAAVDWQAVAADVHQKGFAHVRGVLPERLRNGFIADYDRPIYRKTVVMERHQFGLGEYKYYDYPLPAFIQTAREVIYPGLAPIANEWSKQLNLSVRYPDSFTGLQQLCNERGQDKPTPLILRYGKGGFNTLHQDLYGEVYFPIQLAFFLSEPDLDYTGGEFVLTQQTPRAQSKVTVLRPRKGDMIAFTTNFRPVRGSRGFYRATMKHGVSEVTSGERYTLGVIFHDALS
jgi:hypothetical protein